MLIIIFEGEYFQGTIVDTENAKVNIKCMVMNGYHWRWPEKDDIMWYEKEDIIETIKTPELLNSRGQYSVAEVAKIFIY